MEPSVIEGATLAAIRVATVGVALVEPITISGEIEAVTRVACSGVIVRPP